MYAINEGELYGNIAIHCRSNDQAKAVLSELKRLCYRWESGGAINPNDTKYRADKGQVYYTFTDGELGIGYANYVDPDDYDEVYEFSEIMERQSTAHAAPRPATTTARTTTTSATAEKKGSTTMNMFGINVEFGMSQDQNIAGTLLGVAVKHGDSWRIYNKEKGAMTDIGGIEPGNLPLFVMPTTKLERGDLIKSEGGYFYVIDVNGNNIKALSADSGVLAERIDVSNILGMKCYTKVVALTEGFFGGADGDNDKALLMAMAFSGAANGGAGDMGNALLPLLLFKDGGFGGGDSMFKIVALSGMMGGGSMDQNSLLPLLLLKDELFPSAPAAPAAPPPDAGSYSPAY